MNYYTPKIEEFYVGFEYESMHKGEWIKDKITQVCDIPEDDLEHNNGSETRVKYLDKEDIESLGFTYSKDMMYALSKFSNKKIHILFNNYDNKIVIMRNDDHMFTEQDTIYFSGKIRNKSELKQILKIISVI